MNEEFDKVDVLVVGAGPAGLAAAITAKRLKPELAVCVLDKGAAPGNHALSGAVLEAGCLDKLLDPVDPAWRQSKAAGEVLAARVAIDDILLLGRHRHLQLRPLLKLARRLQLGYGRMIHEGDYICSLSRLTAWLAEVAASLGVEMMPGFAAAEILWDHNAERAAGVKLVDQGRAQEGEPQVNFRAGETVRAACILLAEGADGLLGEQFIAAAGLERQGSQLYSLGVKELIRVSEEQYRAFTPERAVHAMGYPLWRPLLGPDIFGGGIMYPMGDNRIAVGIIAGLDYPYADFNPQDALARFKEQPAVARYISGGTVVEAGAKMIPEGGLQAVPRCPRDGAIGWGNVALLGDSAGLVNMLKIKGIHNAIASGMAAAEALAAAGSAPEKLAADYTAALERAGVLDEMAEARNFRQYIGRFGTTAGLLLAVANRLLPSLQLAPDYTHYGAASYPFKPSRPFDKDAFTAKSGTGHREEEPCHLLIADPAICRDRCRARYGAPCITFCPAGVYEQIGEQPRPANPSNCLHCKTCQRKCPYDNIRWTVPEGGDGPRYATM
ncbi:MAG: electron-transfer flavoprotein:ubiquinone oxidoreductase [Desulfurivibrio sp.]|nr:electron-transfer flavoprotein:ubiquinone oxidoreductase [Desulfurivibrio sp.]